MIRTRPLFVVLLLLLVFVVSFVESFTPKTAICSVNRRVSYKSSSCSLQILKASAALVMDETFVRPNTNGITEDECIAMMKTKMQRILIPVPESIHSSGTVGISYTHWPSTSSKSSSAPIFLVHGFDSSNLEFRRLGPQLAAAEHDVYAVDLLGWGYTQLKNVSSFSAESKIIALQNFIATILASSSSSTNEYYIAGASLGGAAAIETAAASANNNNDDDDDVTPICKGLVLLDAQGFVDGIGPMALLPTPLAKLGVQVLKSEWLRSSANQMSYVDKERYATDEAVLVGRVHTERDGWDDAMVNFMQSGGFTPSRTIAKITNIPTLVLWGRQDTILDGTEFVPKFQSTLSGPVQVQWIEDCGHVPHLEQPTITANAIASFMNGENGIDS